MGEEVTHDIFSAVGRGEWYSNIIFYGRGSVRSYISDGT
jgi:hypothetical protein